MSNRAPYKLPSAQSYPEENFWKVSSGSFSTLLLIASKISNLVAFTGDSIFVIK